MDKDWLTGSKIVKSLADAYNKNAIYPLQDKQDIFFKKHDSKGLAGVIIHHNNEFTDELSPPKGNILIFEDDTPLKINFISPRLGSIIILVPILESGKYTNGYFKGQLNKLLLLDESTTNSIDFNLLLSSSLKDSSKWIPTLGSYKNSVSVIKTKNGRDKCQYYIRVQSGPQAAGTGLTVDLQRKKLERKNMTIGEFCDSQMYKTLLLLVKRNAQRLAFNAAKILNVNVRHYGDPWAKVENMEYEPQLAEPTVENVFYSMRKQNIDGVKSVIIYNHVVDTMGAKGGVLFSGDPSREQRLYSLYDKKNNYHTKGFKNSAWNSFPGFTSKKRSYELHDIDKPIISRSFAEKMKKTITWKTKASTGDLNHPIFSLNHKGMGDTSITSEAHKYNVSVLGAKYGYVDFKTVSCVISSPK